MERITRQTFRKEIIGRTIIDFANENYLIEHTKDWTKGVGEATDRLQSVKDDARRKVLITYVSRLGPVRLPRCEGLELLEVEDFEAGRWIDENQGTVG